MDPFPAAKGHFPPSRADFPACGSHFPVFPFHFWSTKNHFPNPFWAGRLMVFGLGINILRQKRPIFSRSSLPTEEGRRAAGLSRRSPTKADLQDAGALVGRAVPCPPVLADCHQCQRMRPHLPRRRAGDCAPYQPGRADLLVSHCNPNAWLSNSSPSPPHQEERAGVGRPRPSEYQIPSPQP